MFDILFQSPAILHCLFRQTLNLIKMKKLTFLFALLLSFTSTQLLTAQTNEVAYAATNQQQTTVSQNNADNDPQKVEILTAFKATKQQKKAIAKINKYVTPRILGRVRHTDGLLGKKVKAQINFGANGTITAITIIEGMGEKIDAKVTSLIKEYDEKKPIGQAVGNASAIQLDVPLVSKKYFVN